MLLIRNRQSKDRVLLSIVCVCYSSETVNRRTEYSSRLFVCATHQKPSIEGQSTPLDCLCVLLIRNRQSKDRVLLSIVCVCYSSETVNRRTEYSSRLFVCATHQKPSIEGQSTPLDCLCVLLIRNRQSKDRVLLSIVCVCYSSETVNRRTEYSSRLFVCATHQKPSIEGQSTPLDCLCVLLIRNRQSKDRVLLSIVCVCYSSETVNRRTEYSSRLFCVLLIRNRQSKDRVLLSIVCVCYSSETVNRRTEYSSRLFVCATHPFSVSSPFLVLRRCSLTFISYCDASFFALPRRKKCHVR